MHFRSIKGVCRFEMCKSEMCILDSPASFCGLVAVVDLLTELWFTISFGLVVSFPVSVKANLNSIPRDLRTTDPRIQNFGGCVVQLYYKCYHRNALYKVY